MALTEAQIIDLLNDPSNDDFYRYATDLKNRLDSERGFAIELNKKFPDVDTTSHHRIYKIVEKFCKEYKTKHDAAYLRAERKVKIDKLYLTQGVELRCTICGIIEKSKSKIKKHIRGLHLSTDIKNAVDEDEILAEYKSAPFFLQGIRNKPNVAPPPTHSEKVQILLNKHSLQKHDIQDLCKELKRERKRSGDAEARAEDEKRRADILEEDLRKLQEENNLDNTIPEELEPVDEAFIDAPGPLKSYITIDRASSISDGAFHGTKHIYNENVPGKQKVQPTVFVEVALPRKRKSDDQEDDGTLNRDAKKRVANKTNNFLAEVTGRALNNTTPAPATKNPVIQTLIRKQGKENLPNIVTPDLQHHTAFTPEVAASIVTQNQWSRREVRNLQRATANTGGRKLFVNEKKVNEARKKQSKGITEDLFEVTSLQLQNKRQGEEKYVLISKGVVYVKNIEEYIKILIKDEGDDQEFEVLPDGTLKVIVGLTGDAGGGSNKFSISLMDYKTKAKDHVILWYDGADTMMNTVKAMSCGLRKSMEELNDKVIQVEGKHYLIHFQGCFDLKGQDELLGHQGSSCIRPCSKCMVSKNHLSSHGNIPHCEENCPELKEQKCFKYYEKSYRKCFQTSHKQILKQLENGDEKNQISTLEKLRKLGKDTGSVVSPNLLPFTDIIDVVDPILHIQMGLTNDNLVAMKKECRKLDECVSSEIVDKYEKEITLLQARTHKMQVEMDNIYSGQDLIENISLKRLRNVAEGKVNKAERRAHKYYNIKLNDRPFENTRENMCQSKFCLLFTVDGRHNNDMKLECSSCKRSVHWLCEGLCEASHDIRNGGRHYKCHMCEKKSVDEIEEKFHTEIATLTSTRKIREGDNNNWLQKINQKKHDLDLVRGPAEKQLEESYRKAGVAPMSYHGGSLNGKDCEKILKEAVKSEKVEDFEITKCLSKNPEMAKKFFHMFKILGNCLEKLKCPPKDEADIQDTIKKCQEWCRQLPLLFPDRNITRKGHVLSVHVPQYLVKFPNYLWKFYALEQRGESLHARCNRLLRTRFFSVKPDQMKILKTILELERLNNISVELFEPRKYNVNKV